MGEGSEVSELHVRPQSRKRRGPAVEVVAGMADPLQVRAKREVRERWVAVIQLDDFLVRVVQLAITQHEAAAAGFEVVAVRG